MTEAEENALSRSPSAEPLDSLPAGVQDNIGIICGDVRGVLLIQKARVLYQGHDISPTEFEKLGGRSASKKWKSSLRIINPDGTAGQLIGDWLQSQGVDIKHSQLVRFTGKGSPPARSLHRPELRPPAPKPSPAPKLPPAVKPGGLAVKPPRPAAAVKPQPVQTPSVDLLVHLQSQYVGFIPGDPTVEGVPEVLPASSVGSDVTVIDLERMSYEDLMKLSRESAPDPLGALLPNQPGILLEREARLTGHQPAKRPRVTRAVDANEAAALVGDYMAGRLADPPWGAFGLSREPVICGYELDLHHLYNAVQSHGGFDATISNKCWGKVATKLGIDKTTHTNASFVLRNTYSKFLLAYETQARALSMRKSVEERTPTQEEPLLQHESERHQAESVGAPSAAPMDVPGQGSGSAAAVVDLTVEPVAAVQDTPQQTADDGKADAPSTLAQQTADVDMPDGMDDRKLEHAPIQAESVEGTSAMSLENDHTREPLHEQSLSDAAGWELLQGATVLKPASQASNSQDVDIID